MINYIRESIRRKIARRVTREYDYTINTLKLDKDGEIQFANWNNPLAPEIEINQNTVDFFRKFIKQGDMAIDIGTNIGDTTVPMALAAGVSGLTIGFDPNPFVFKILEVNASLNKEKTKILPYRLAITHEDEEFYFISSEASFGNGAISKIRDKKHGRFVFPEKVKGINLMNFLSVHHESWLRKLSFIKIDAEGYDKEIIKSISSLFEKYRPVLVAECFGDNSDEEKLELFDVIEKHGYELYYFSDFDINAEISEIRTREEILKYRKTINIYAMPR